MGSAPFVPYCPVGYALNPQGNLCVGTGGNQTAPSCPPGYGLNPQSNACIVLAAPVGGTPLQVGGPGSGGSFGPAGNWNKHGPFHQTGQTFTPGQQQSGQGGAQYCTDAVGGGGSCGGPVVAPIGPVTVPMQPAPPTTNPVNPLNCTGYMVPNSTGNACVLSCPSGTLQDPSGTTCDTVCPSGYQPDPTNTFCELTSTATTTTTTTTDVTTEIENFVTQYWLYILGAVLIYYLFFSKRRR
jgi:hypothetical protein